MTEFLTKQTEVEAYEFDGSIASAAAIAEAVGAIELRYVKDVEVCGPEGVDRKGPRCIVVGDFTGGATLYEGDWLVVWPTVGETPSRFVPYGPQAFTAEFEEKPVG